MILGENSEESQTVTLTSPKKGGYGTRTRVSFLLNEEFLSYATQCENLFLRDHLNRAITCNPAHSYLWGHRRRETRTLVVDSIKIDECLFYTTQKGKLQTRGNFIIYNFQRLAMDSNHYTKLIVTLF